MKKFLCSISVVLIAVLCCACHRQDTAEKIKFATWGSKTEMDIITPIVDEYNKNNDVKVEIVHVPQNYFQKLHLLFASNLAPDVIFINNQYLKIYQKANLLEDLSPYINKNDYFENVISALSVDGKIYVTPRDVSSFVIFYNKDIFKKAGIKIPKNMTMDDFYSIANKVKTYTDYGFCTELEPAYWENFVSTSGKPIFYNGELSITDTKSLTAIQELADKINKEKIGVSKEQLVLSPCAQLFLTNKSAMFVSGRWSMPKLNSQKDFDYGVLPFPDGGSGFYIPLNASGWAVSKKSKHKNEALSFVQFISNDENIVKLTKSGLITPAKKSVANSKYFENGEVFVSVIEKSTPNVVPNDYNVIIDKLNVKISSVLGGYKTVQEVFEDKN